MNMQMLEQVIWKPNIHMSTPTEENPMPNIRGIRGAIQVDEDRPDLIMDATRQLLLAILDENPSLEPEDLASIFFTATTDLTAVHPALAARQLGWQNVPLLCAQEIPVPNSLPRVVRVLAHWNTPLPQDQVRHVYLGATRNLRPDLHPIPSMQANGKLE
jgi:chorismate mutase